MLLGMCFFRIRMSVRIPLEKVTDFSRIESNVFAHPNVRNSVFARSSKKPCLIESEKIGGSPGVQQRRRVGDLALIPRGDRVVE